MKLYTAKTKYLTVRNFVVLYGAEYISRKKQFNSNVREIYEIPNTNLHP